MLKVVIFILILTCFVAGFVLIYQTKRTCAAVDLSWLCFSPPRSNDGDDWNLLYLHDRNGRSVPDWVVLRGEFWSAKAEKKFQSSVLTPRTRILLLSSYQEFPLQIKNPHENRGPTRQEDRVVHRYAGHLAAICYCARQNPLPDLPNLLLSESDYIHCQALAKRHPDLPIKYDFVASICDGDWNDYIRNRPVVQRVFNEAVGLGLRVAVAGGVQRGRFDARVEVLPFLPHHEFIKFLASSRALLCAAGPDASPRILVEAGAVGTLAFVNADIVGGWKYFQEQEMFQLETVTALDLLHFLDRLPSRQSVQERFQAATQDAGHKLGKFISEIMRGS